MPFDNKQCAIIGPEEALAHDWERIKPRLQIVKESGFGEVRILVKNGAVYRIIKSEDEIVERES